MCPKVTKEQRELILKYGAEHGISKACRKYSISRTIYYRWKKRFDESGFEGLTDRVRHFIPVNKLTVQIEQTLFIKITEHPDYGPLSLKWLLEEDEIYISASGVYNILKRNHLSRRDQREKFSSRYKQTRPLLKGFEPSYGQLWLYWIDERKDLIRGESVFQYSIMDVRSAVSCSRLYPAKNHNHALDLLLGLAVPMAKELNMKPEIILSPDDKIFTAGRGRTDHSFKDALKSLKIRQITWDINFQDFIDLTYHFSRQSLNYLQKHSGNKESLEELKSELQHFLREYNLKETLAFGPGIGFSPIENVKNIINQEINLPLWAYLDRQY